MLYILNLHNAVYQLHFSKPGKHTVTVAKECLKCTIHFLITLQFSSKIEFSWIGWLTSLTRCFSMIATQENPLGKGGFPDPASHKGHTLKTLWGDKPVYFKGSLSLFHTRMCQGLDIRWNDDVVFLFLLPLSERSVSRTFHVTRLTLRQVGLKQNLQDPEAA